MIFVTLLRDCADLPAGRLRERKAEKAGSPISICN
jgi:hypothetical protein